MGRFLTVVISKRKLVIACVFMLTLAAWWQVSRWYEGYLLDVQHLEAKNQLSNHAKELSLVLNQRIALLEGLAAFIRTDLASQDGSTHVDKARLNSFMSGLYASTKSIRGFSIAPNGVVDQIYPIESNLAAIGHDLLLENVPEVYQAAVKAAKTRTIVVSPPYELRQGGLGLVARIPVYFQGELWGLVGVVLDISAMIKEAELIHDDVVLNFALRSDKGDVFYGAPELFEQGAMLQSIELPDDKWEVAAPLVIEQEKLTTQLNIFRLLSLAFMTLLLGFTLASSRRFEEQASKNSQDISETSAGLFYETKYSITSLVPDFKDTDSHAPPTWLAPTVASVATILGCMAFYWYLQGNNATTQQAELDRDLKSIRGAIEQKLDADKAYLEILAQEIGQQNLLPQGFVDKGEQYVENHPGLINITLADESFVIRYTTPYEKNKQVIGLTLSLPEPERVSRLAKNLGQSVYTKPFIVIQGDPAFELYVPIFNNGKFKGTLGGVYSIRNLLDNIATEEMKNKYVISVLDGAGDILFADLPEGDHEHLTKSAPVMPLNNTLWISLSSKKLGLSQNIQWLILFTALFVLGICLSFWLQYRESNRYWRTGKALLESQQHFRSIAQASPMAIVITDPETAEIYYANIRAEELLGFSSGDLIGHRTTEFYANPKDRERFARKVSRHNRVEGFELRMTKADGEEFWGVLSSQQVSYGKGMALITSITDLTEQKNYQNQLFHKANYDELTDLPNRGLAFDRLQRSLDASQRSQKKVALMLVDLDDFKKVNDSFGHSAGDALLQEVAKRLNACVREGDTVARLGGDEFTIILSGLSYADDAESVAQKLLESFSLPVMLGNHEVAMGASIGIAMYPDDGEDFETLIKNADAAMYQCKKAGRNTLRFYTAQMNEKVKARLVMEKELRQALSNNEFYLNYQPLIDSSTGKVVGAEALLRWFNPNLGQVPPGRFIALAESLGMINDIGWWVMKRVCHDLKEWEDKNSLPDYVSINVSSYQIRQAELVSNVAKVLAESGLEANRLELEITESALLENSESSQLVFDALHEMGLRIAIDDFGTGYSSLSYLRRFPFDTLKIDRSFINDIPQDIEANQLVDAIISMANAMNLRVVAEGVENEEQLAFLKQLDCHLIQGFYLAKPMPLSQLKAFCHHEHGVEV